MIKKLGFSCKGILIFLFNIFIQYFEEVYYMNKFLIVSERIHH